MNPLLRVLGLMSGTSLDGLDIAYVEIYQVQGRFKLKNTYFKTYAYPDVLRQQLIKNSTASSASLDQISYLNVALADFFVECIHQFMHQFNLHPQDVDLIGSHGHTFYHQVEQNKVLSTLQLGEPAVIAAKTGITTVADFRPFDVALGGQGAPLVPLLDQVLLGGATGVAFQNIGGIANVAFADKDQLIAFDNGPGNMLLDAAIYQLSEGQLSYDKDGAWAAKGMVNVIVVQECLKDPYFALPIPKTTGRAKFGAHYVKALFDKFEYLSLSKYDWMASLTEFVALSIVQSYQQHLSVFPQAIVVSGGGAYNPQLMACIQQAISKEKCQLKSIQTYGIQADAKEAVAFALLAYCTVFAIPNNVPTATGATAALVMGKICPSANFSRLLLQKQAVGTRNAIGTESQHLLSQQLDLLTPEEIIELMHVNDYDMLQSIKRAKEAIAAVMKACIDVLSSGGRLFYVGAGTSGRLGVLDASECPPTFRTDPALVQGIIAGGINALTTAVEHAEDSFEAGHTIIHQRMEASDMLIGISANGHAAFVHGALSSAHKVGAKTALITCNQLQSDFEYINQLIVLLVGPEVLSGSTRLKAGTATKIVLNMLTTGSFAKLGKVYGNYMVDLNVSNQKLEKRAINIIVALCKVDSKEAAKLLKGAQGSVKTALLMHKASVDFDTASRMLSKYNGFLRNALNEL